MDLFFTVFCFSTSLRRFPEDFSLSPTTCAACLKIFLSFPRPAQPLNFSLKISVCIRRPAQKWELGGRTRAKSLFLVYSICTMYNTWLAFNYHLFIIPETAISPPLPLSKICSIAGFCSS